MQEPFYNEVVGRRPQACNLIKKEVSTQVEVKIISRTALLQKEQLWTTASGYIRSVTVKLKCHKDSVAELIISKSYKEAERRRATRGVEVGGLPCPFLRIEKSALILKKRL